MSPEFCGVSNPAAAPCSSRAATATPAVGAIPTAAEPMMNPVRPISIMRRRPSASPSLPPVTRVSPKVSAYPETTHWIVDGLAFSPC